jgi:hypothetical protein
LHVAHRPGAAQASGGFNQPNACASLRRANGSSNACSASTDNENVILIFHNHSFALDGFSDEPRESAKHDLSPSASRASAR